MSYNIDTFKLKKLNNFSIPFDKFFIHDRKDWYPEIEYPEQDDKSIIVLNCGCDQEICGVLDRNNVLQIKQIDLSGEGSGVFRNYILDPILKHSKGIFEASMVWEGGDSITNLIVDNGNVTETKIEL